MLRALALLAIIALPLAATAGPRDGDAAFERLERSGLIRFRTADGGVFDPARLVLLTDTGAFEARMPGTPREVRNEDRMDLSALPVIGQVFAPGLSTGDAAAAGVRIGQVFRREDSLIVDARGQETPADLPVTLTTVLPRVGAVSFRLGRLRFEPGGSVATGEPVGAAYRLDGHLVLASTGGEPQWPSVDALIEALY